MQIQMFDVAHGFCAYVVADNGNTMLVDCGHNDETGFYPAAYLVAHGCSGIERFFLLNYDEDHVSGLPRLRSMADRIPIQILHRNTSISVDEMRRLKLRAGPLGPGMTAFLEMARNYTGENPVPPEYPNLEYAVFWNDYPYFEDTNNLSVVLFLHYPGISIVFPGDLERAGWLELIERDQFRAQLARVNIFVASHHGRESGYCPEVFAFCKPSAVIVSDEEKKYDTQKDWYGKHATGIRWNKDGSRRVLTTRNDGMLTITPRSEGGFHILATR